MASIDDFLFELHALLATDLVENRPRLPLSDPVHWLCLCDPMTEQLILERIDAQEFAGEVKRRATTAYATSSALLTLTGSKVVEDRAEVLADVVTRNPTNSDIRRADVSFEDSVAVTIGPWCYVIT